MDIKVIIRDGIVESVLVKDVSDKQPNIEIVSVDKDYEDSEQLRDYTEALYADPTYQEYPFTCASFRED